MSCNFHPAVSASANGETEMSSDAFLARIPNSEQFVPFSLETT